MKTKRFVTLEEHLKRSASAKKLWEERGPELRKAFKNGNNDGYRTDEHRELKRALSVRVWTPEKREEMSKSVKERYKNKEYYDKWYEKNLISVKSEERSKAMTESLKEYKALEKKKKLTYSSKTK